MISAALFDFGGVLTSSPFERFAAYEASAGLPVGLIRRINSTNPDDNAWAHFERNLVDRAGFCAEFEAEAAALGHEVDGEAVLACLDGEIRPEMVRAVEQCGPRLKTALLTNNFAAGDGDDERHHQVEEIHELFDLVVESSKVGYRKPDRRFYEIACRGLGVDPAECVFLDDLGINLKPARAMGMTTIKVADPVVALAELEAAVGFPLR